MFDVVHFESPQILIGSGTSVYWLCLVFGSTSKKRLDIGLIFMSLKVLSNKLVLRTGKLLTIKKKIHLFVYCSIWNWGDTSKIWQKSVGEDSTFMSNSSVYSDVSWVFCWKKEADDNYHGSLYTGFDYPLVQAGCIAFYLITAFWIFFIFLNICILHRCIWYLTPDPLSS